MTEHNFKTRFTPSPTGVMHLGNLRTALFSFLLASPLEADAKSTFLIRIEDTDASRSKTEYTEKLLADLKWLGMDWQEGPEVGGANGPYFQSQRLEVYENYYQQLIEMGRAYPCYCTEKELQIARRAQLQAGHAPRYPGTCRHLTEAAIAKKEAMGIKPALRFVIPDNEEVRFEDLIQGPKSFQSDDIGDFIIRKNDGSASFMFCNAVDDSLMGVSHVLRGEDHITNTPRQLLVLKALGLSAPQYGHMALIIGDDGKPLSKRNGSQSVESLREQGFFPLSILNYLSRLGHHYETDAVLDWQALGHEFKIDHISRSPSRFDLSQMRHWQKEVILRKDEATLWEWMKASIEDTLPEEKHAAFVHTIKDNIILIEDAKMWANQLFGDKVPVEEKNQAFLDEAGSTYFEAAIEAFEHHGPDKGAVFDHIKEKCGVKGKKLFMPMRVAISGVSYGPEMDKLFALLGKESLIQRMKEQL